MGLPIDYNIKFTGTALKPSFTDLQGRFYSLHNVPVIANAKKVWQLSMGVKTPSRSLFFDTMVGKPGYFLNTYIPHLYRSYNRSPFIVLDHQIQLRPESTMANMPKTLIPLIIRGHRANHIGPYHNSNPYDPKSILVIGIPEFNHMPKKYNKATTGSYRPTTNTTPIIPFLLGDAMYIALPHEINHSLTSPGSSTSYFLDVGHVANKLPRETESHERMHSNTPGFFSSYTLNPILAIQAAVANHQGRVALSTDMKANPGKYTYISPLVRDLFIAKYSKPFTNDVFGRQRFIDYINFVKKHKPLLYHIGPLAARFVISADLVLKAKNITTKLRLLAAKIANLSFRYKYYNDAPSVPKDTYLLYLLGVRSIPYISEYPKAIDNVWDSYMNLVPLAGNTKNSKPNYRYG